MFVPKSRSVPRKRLQIVQKSFPKGVVTVLQASRTPNTALSDMTNMDMIQDSIARPRSSTVVNGPVSLGTIIGIGTFVKYVNGKPQKWQITTQVIAGVAQVVINKDAGAWQTIGGSYDLAAWCMFTQINNRVYVSNGVNNMSYYDVNAGTIVPYTALAAPGVPTITGTTALTATLTQSYYYAVTATNNIGETAPVISAVKQVSKLRGSWTVGTDSLTITTTAVTNAINYNWYICTSGLVTDLQYVTTTSAPTLTDDGSTIINIFKAVPATDSTAGPILSYMINANGQLFGTGDPTSPHKVWYSGKNAASGTFAPGFGNNGGYFYVNYGGDSNPTTIQFFHDGRGSPLITVLTRGVSGSGKFYHANETSTSYGTQVINYFQTYEANGQSGTISPFGVVQANNNIYYPTGDSFKSTGTQPNIVNILSTQSISQAIDPDVRKLNLSAMNKCVGLYFNSRIHWAVANGTNSNNEIWTYDLLTGQWILRWLLMADWLWLYEDNSGITHFCALVANRIVEFTRSVSTTDQGVPFRTRLASGSLVWDNSGIAMATIQTQYFKFLYPRGQIYINNYGVGDDSTGQQTLGGSSYSVAVTNTGYGQWDYSGLYQYGDDVGPINTIAQATGVVLLEPDETLNELSWEIITTDANCDYTLSTVTTRGVINVNQFLGD